MMKTVASGTNIHVVKMIGCVTIQEPLALILEFVPYGNLLDYLRTNRKLVRVCTVHRGHVVYIQPQLVRVCFVHRGHVVYIQPQLVRVCFAHRGHVVYSQLQSNEVIIRSALSVTVIEGGL